MLGLLLGVFMISQIRLMEKFQDEVKQYKLLDTDTMFNLGLR
jgi:hypothetical protein